MFHTDLGRADTVLGALEMKRPGVAAHSRRVSAYSVRLAAQFGLADDVIETIRLGALLHDVGKLLTPSRILEKPGRPNAREWQELKIDPELGAEICHRSGFDDEVCAIVLHHHERGDGSGYPDKLAHPSIPYTVRIVAVMDTLDALTSSRDYRDRLSVPAARTLIARAAGSKVLPLGGERPAGAARRDAAALARRCSGHRSPRGGPGRPAGRGPAGIPALHQRRPSRVPVLSGVPAGVRPGSDPD